MPETPAIFDRQLEFDPSMDLDVLARQAPAKWVVYLMADAEDRPVQLLCVKNLRNSLKRRLGPDEGEDGPSRRVNYRELVRRIRWVRVDSAFEADWLYYEAARVVFPESYRGMVGFRPAWFVHIDPHAQFPRYTKTVDLGSAEGELIGPVEDKHAAARLMQLMEDAFDLCRYHHILIQSPNASACAYKEMGRCPAPCDGSISLAAYRQRVQQSVETLIDPVAALRQQTQWMNAAAADLRFEVAAKIKTTISQLSQLGKGPFRHARRLSEFAHLSFQHGPREGQAKLFLITPGRIEQILGLIDAPLKSADILRVALERANQSETHDVDSTGAERIGIVAHHLFSARSTHGVFLPLGAIDEKAITKAYRDLQKQSAMPEEADGEGVLKELQSL